MRAILALAAVAAMATTPAVPALAGAAPSSGSWYYCDAAHAYYPYVSTCAAPWRAVVPYAYGQPEPKQPPAAPRVAPASVAPVPTAQSRPGSQSGASQQGQMDRQAWETWFSALTGDYRAGAEYWAGQRSLPNPGSCSEFSAAAPHGGEADWADGCLTAQQKLAASDVRRKTEPEYRLGWNSPPPGAASPVPTNSGAALGAPSSSMASEPAARTPAQSDADSTGVYAAALNRADFETIGMNVSQIQGENPNVQCGPLDADGGTLCEIGPQAPDGAPTLQESCPVKAPCTNLVIEIEHGRVMGYMAGFSQAAFAASLAEATKALGPAPEHYIRDAGPIPMHTEVWNWKNLHFMEFAGRRPRGRLFDSYTGELGASFDSHTIEVGIFDKRKGPPATSESGNHGR